MKELQDPIFVLDSQEKSLLSLAYIQMLAVKALLYFATENGKLRFVPVPAMIASSIIKAVYEHAYGAKPHFLPQNRLDGQYPHYPRDIFNEEFWWDRDVVSAAQKEMLAVPDIPEAMRAVVITVISESSVLHPNGLMGIRMAGWWAARPCGPHQDNLRVYLTKENKMEAMVGLLRLGAVNASWCATIGSIMGKCMDESLINGRCGECHPTHY